MEQEIQFCTTTDGASIAYATVGSGPPLVYVCGWPGNIATEWEREFAREFLESFAAEFTLVRYDMRNTGLSGKDTDDFSLDALVRDLEAVVDELKLDQIALMSLGLLGGPIALTYADRHSDRVSRVVALGPYLLGSHVITEQQYKALSDYVTAFGRLATPDDFRDPQRYGLDPETVNEAARIHEESTSPSTQAALLETLYRADLTEVAERLDMPVLVLHGSGDGRVSLEASREVAARIRDVQFVPYQGTGAAPWADSNVILPHIFRFFGAVPPQSAVKARRPEVGMFSILFTDIEGSTALTQRLGDAKAREVLRTHERIVREALRASGGSEVKTMGDGFMASFSSATRALECAIAIQRAFAQHNESAQEAILVRIGLNAGEPIAEEEDLFGTAVIMAARIAAHGAGGQILASNVIRELVAGKEFLFSDRGETALRGFEDPARLYEVRWQEEE